MSLGRNEKCHCGSGKKYKNCCLQKDLEAAREAEREEQRKAALAKESQNNPDVKLDENGEVIFEEKPSVGMETWKVAMIGLAILGALFLVFHLSNYTRLGGSIFGVGALILLVYCAFRNVPTVRSQTGNGGNIDFGNR